MQTRLFILFATAIAFPLLASQVKTVSFSELEKMWKKDNDTTYVVNFWATWCAPCIKEMPYFEKLNKEYKDKKVKVILVSLDFKGQVEKRLLPFIKKKGLKSKVVHLYEPDANNWIPKVHKDWTGSIPATLVVNNKKKYKAFFEAELTYEDLVKAVTIK